VIWIAFGGIALLVLLAFAFVGAPHLFRTTPVRHVVDFGSDRTVLDFESPALPEAVWLTTQASLEPGSTAELLNDGDGTFPRLWEDLKAARHSITIVSYFGKPGQVTDTLASILAERARAGVEVRWVHDSVGCGKLTVDYFEPICAAGVRTAAFRELRWYTLDRANNRSHVRSIVIDGTVGYTGGFGFDDNWLGNGRTPGQWRDCNVRLTGPVVSRLQSTFITHWAEAANELIVSDSLARANGEDEPELLSAPGAIPLEAAGILISGGTLGSSSAERLLAMTIALARRSLLITNAYFVPDDDFIDLLIAAKRRGVDVRVLTNGARSDVKPALWAGRRRYERMLDAHIRIYEYQPALLHAKTLVADGIWSVVGTINFDNRSLAFNNEIALIAADRTLGTALERQFSADLSYAREIELAAFRRRSARDRILERSADRLWRWV
jgi:cardiolipin synthase